MVEDTSSLFDLPNRMSPLQAQTAEMSAAESPELEAARVPETETAKIPKDSRKVVLEVSTPIYIFFFQGRNERPKWTAWKQPLYRWKDPAPHPGLPVSVRRKSLSFGSGMEPGWRCHPEDGTGTNLRL